MMALSFGEFADVRQMVLGLAQFCRGHFCCSTEHKGESGCVSVVKGRELVKPCERMD